MKEYHVVLEQMNQVEQQLDRSFDLLSFYKLAKEERTPLLRLLQ